MSSFEQLNKLVNSTVKAMENSEKIFIPSLTSKLASAISEYPEDKTMGIMKNILSKMTESKAFITRAELKDLYNKLHVSNTKFAEIFQDELGTVQKLQEPKFYERNGDENSFEDICQKNIDPILANSLAGVFGDKMEKFSKETGEKAVKLCSRDLRDIGTPAIKISVVAGQDDLIICNASFETPKGISSILIPIEVINEKPLSASVFIGNNGPLDLSEKTVSDYIKSTAGQKLNINAEKTLQLVSLAKNGKQEKINNVELALTKLNASKENSNYFGDQIIGQKLDDYSGLEVQLPTYQDKEISSFAELFSSKAGVAEFKFGKQNINKVKNIIANQIKSFGFDNQKISIANVSETDVVFAVSVNGGRTAFNVPVKMASGIPTVIISNGSVKSFSQLTINSLLAKEDCDYKAASVASPNYNLKSSELINIIREAVEEENFAKAEDALNVLSEREDEQSYNVAFNAFKSGLTKKASTNIESKCTHIVKSANSNHPICGHLNLPLHKVYQDRFGQCVPAYRHGQDETFEGGMIMAHKVLL